MSELYKAPLQYMGGSRIISTNSLYLSQQAATYTNDLFMPEATLEQFTGKLYEAQKRAFDDAALSGLKLLVIM